MKTNIAGFKTCNPRILGYPDYNFPERIMVFIPRLKRCFLVKHESIFLEYPRIGHRDRKRYWL